MQIKFTEQTLSTLSVPSGMRDHQWFDAGLPGFGFRKFASGQAAFFVKYRVGQKQRKVTLSKYTLGILAQMRRKAADVLAEARLGNDARAKTTHRPAIGDISLGDVVREGLRMPAMTHAGSRGGAGVRKSLMNESAGSRARRRRDLYGDLAVACSGGALRSCASHSGRDG